MASSDRPSGLIAKSGIELLTFGTPNGFKASILLEELKEAYGKEYTFQSINISQNVQKEPWFTKIGRNGRIPAIVDHDRNDFAVFEGFAILTYLTRHYDPEHKFSFTDPDDVSRAEQWIAWQTGGLVRQWKNNMDLEKLRADSKQGPMMGQANHFRFAKERFPYAIQRYVGESERLFGVLDIQLQDRDYLVGPARGKYSIADISSFGWVNAACMTGLDFAQFPNVEKWWARINERPAVAKGLEVPSGPSKFGNKAFQTRLKEEEGFKESQAEMKAVVDEAKEKYGYKFASP
jgi:glutathione S-transferase